MNRSKPKDLYNLQMKSMRLSKLYGVIDGLRNAAFVIRTAGDNGALGLIGLAAQAAEESAEKLRKEINDECRDLEGSIRRSGDAS